MDIKCLECGTDEHLYETDLKSTTGKKSVKIAFDLVVKCRKCGGEYEVEYTPSQINRIKPSRTVNDYTPRVTGGLN